MSAKKKSFLDTNILVYQFDDASPEKKSRSMELIEKLFLEDSAVISSQVVQEFMNVALNKFPHQLPADEVKNVIRDLLKPLCLHFPNFEFYERAISLYTTKNLSYYDALIVQAAIDLNCATLYTEDLQAGQQFGTLTVVNPFKN